MNTMVLGYEIACLTHKDDLVPRALLLVEIRSCAEFSDQFPVQ